MISFDFPEESDGFIIQLVHSGKFDNYRLLGSVRGLKGGPIPWKLPSKGDSWRTLFSNYGVPLLLNLVILFTLYEFNSLFTSNQHTYVRVVLFILGVMVGNSFFALPKF